TDTPIPPPLQIARVPYLGEAAFRLMMGELGLTMMWFAAVKKRSAFPLRRYREVLRFSRGLRSTRQVFVRSLRNLSKLYKPVQDSLASVTVPALVIWGDAEPFFAVDVGRRTASAIPGARFLLIADCGHFVPAEHSETVAAAISQLIAAAAVPGSRACR
ncbi:MAG TPA: alpha/beta hydrolase, partial [Vicinamibacterales bacterium]|nr:alpha/beta hydrolase [Vicinamibacterales bacterium]